MNDAFCVEGSSIRSKFDYVRETFGPPADLEIAAGFYLGVGKLLGLEDMSLHFQRRDDGAVFDLSWA